MILWFQIFFFILHSALDSFTREVYTLCVQTLHNIANPSIRPMTDTRTLSNVSPIEEGNSSSAGKTTCIVPEARSSQTGVSLRYAYNPAKHWYVFRASYGREDKASDFLVEHGTYVYVAKRYVRKEVKGRRTLVLESLIPNLLFVYTTYLEAKEYAEHSVISHYLSLCYNNCEYDQFHKHIPLTVSHKEMMAFIAVTVTHNEHILFITEQQCHYKYKGGEIVRITDGEFKGIKGRVARVSGQQRVVIQITNVGLITTAYIPKAFLSVIRE